MSPKVKILVVNVHSSLNAGDLALLQTTIDLLRQKFKDCEFLVSANFPKEQALLKIADRVIASPWSLAGGGTSRKTRYLVMNLILGWLAAITPFRYLGIAPLASWKNLFAAYKECDLVVAVSGHQFFSSGRYGWPLLAIAISVKLAEVFKKPAYILPQSIGPLRTGWERWLLRSSYSGARKIYLRDVQSMRFAQEVQLPASRVEFVPDPAFTLKPAFPDEALSILQKYGYQTGLLAIGVTVIASMPSYLDQTLVANYYSSVSQALSYLAERYGIHLFFFYQVVGPSVQEDDRIATDEVIRQLDISAERIHLVKEVLPPAQLKACYGCMDIFLASRLHSGIFSLGMGVPTVFVGYLSKTRGVLEALNLQNNLFELETLTSNALIARLDNLWTNREMEKTALEAITQGIIAQIERAISSIFIDFIVQHD